ncbi:MAG TPA: 16S rRNA (cytosine(967)-C(5))-methyltransferase, partial [Pseudohaliea sp.]|nr:16S rRNA (cytosine(967)-C(5))-methyltransferase [Pseudohaliea sp.]
RLAPGGRLLYVTCSVLDAENDAVIGPFLAEREDARACTPPVAGALPTAHGRQLLPALDGGDGLYFALLAKAP